MTSSLTARDVPPPRGIECDMAEAPTPPTTASWRSSSASPSDVNCVQVACGREHVWVRDSKNTRGPVLRFTLAGWAVFNVGVQGSEFDRSGRLSDVARQPSTIR